MPDARVEVSGIVIHGFPPDAPAVMQGTLVLDPQHALFDAGHDALHLIAAYGALSDAVLLDGSLRLYRGEAEISLSGSDQLQRAASLIMERSCRLPELTRGLRSLGTHRGGDARLQSRFFGPLLLARRRLQEPEALEWRISHFNAEELARRFDGAIQELAEERFPQSPPDRRGLEAELGEALEPVTAALEALDDAGRRVLVSPGGQRFVAWRAWTRALRRVFLEADRAWGLIAPSLQRIP
jgi:hypothetical protein